MSSSTSVKKPVNSAAAPRARFLDYLLLMAGCGLSLYLVELMGVRVSPVSGSTFRQAFQRIVPHLLFLPVGPQLGWPLFFATQLVLGRKQPLTWGEWLLGLAWLGSLVLAIWIVWQATGNIPEVLAPPTLRKSLLFVYMLTVLSLGALALVVWLLDLVWHRPQPWTHTFALVLLLWPSLPLACQWLGGFKLE